MIRDTCGGGVKEREEEGEGEKGSRSRCVWVKV